MPIYPTVLSDLKAACESYRKKLIDEKQLQEIIFRAANEVVAVEESAHRRFLKATEGQIELLRFTVNAGELGSEVAIVLDRIEHHLAEWR